MISIHVYNAIFQSEIDVMLHEIDNEFELPISNENQSNSKPLDKYWVAFHEKELIGTVGILNLGNNNGVLKSIFVKKEYRGKNLGTATLLLQKVLDYCKTEKVNCIYLGTMSQFKAAHQFYENNGFQKINKNELPQNFVNNPIDEVFYAKHFRL